MNIAMSNREATLLWRWQDLSLSLPQDSALILPIAMAEDASGWLGSCRWGMLV